MEADSFVLYPEEDEAARRALWVYAEETKDRELAYWLEELEQRLAREKTRARLEEAARKARLEDLRDRRRSRAKAGIFGGFFRVLGLLK